MCARSRAGAAGELGQLPADLPVPTNDGACDHLVGRRVPDWLAQDGLLVLFVYPYIGHPQEAVPAGWDEVPGARGCTPQSCGFRDLYAGFRAVGATVVGVSTQARAEQRERIERLGLPFELVSDRALRLRDGLGLPTFVFPGRGELYKRVTLVARDGKIERVFYPVFPPDRNAADVLAYIRERSRGGNRP
jgi:peroxiredoxin